MIAVDRAWLEDMLLDSLKLQCASYWAAHCLYVHLRRQLLSCKMPLTIAMTPEDLQCLCLCLPLLFIVTGNLNF